MRYSFPIGRLFGIPVRLHVTFLLLPLFSAWLAHAVSGEVRVAAWSAVMLLLVFGCVLLHELGHCVVARRYGSQVMGITMLPIGGVAWMSHLPERPREEAAVAIAGPLVNVALLALLLPFTGWSALLEGWSRLPAAGSDLPGALARGNLVLCAFNLIPAFPMDGGRLLRAGLATLLPFARATEWAARIGRVVALVLMAFGLGGVPLLVVAGAFVFVAAGREAGAVRQREVWRGQPAAAVMQPAAQLAPGQTVLDVLALAHAGHGPDFVVVEGGAVCGVLSRGRWLAALRAGRGGEPVHTVMASRFPSVSPESDTARVWFDLHRQDLPLVPVLEDGRLLGVLNLPALARGATAAPAAGTWAGRAVWLG